MLERFSSAAFQALNAAREEALRLEFAAVDTDHLLLGLAHEQRGLAARTLNAGGLQLGVRALRQAVERMRGRGYTTVRAEDVVFAASTLRVLGRAAEKPGAVQADGLFMALLDEEDGPVFEAWGALGLERDVLRAKAVALADSPEAEASGEALPAGAFSARVASEPLLQALSVAEGLARQHGHTLVGTEELLAGLASAEGGLAAALLRRLGLRMEVLNALAWRLVGQGSGNLPSRMGWSSYAQRVLDQGWDDARAKGLDHTGTGQVLRALASFQAGGAATLLDHLRVDAGWMLTELDAAFEAAPGEVEPADATAFGARIEADDDPSAWSPTEGGA